MQDRDRPGRAFGQMALSKGEPAHCALAKPRAQAIEKRAEIRHLFALADQFGLRRGERFDAPCLKHSGIERRIAGEAAFECGEAFAKQPQDMRGIMAGPGKREIEIAALTAHVEQT